MEPEVFIRTDASPAIGLGHIVRCIALAHMISPAFKVVFFCRDIPPSIQDEIEKSGFGLQHITTEEDFFSKLIPVSIAVLDGYHFDSDYQKKIKDTGAKLVCIDDLHDKEMFADIVLNHISGVTPADYKAQAYTRFALGPGYALLRPSFLEAARKKRTGKKIETVLVSFGGSDYSNLTERAAKIAAEFPDLKKIIVITGALYNFTDSINALVANDPRIVHYNDVSETQMLSLMEESSMAIVPASGILFEILVMRIPVVTGSYTGNQSIFIEQLSKYDHVFNTIDFSIQYIRVAIQEVLTVPVFCEKIFDGESGSRVKQQFFSLHAN